MRFIILEESLPQKEVKGNISVNLNSPSILIVAKNVKEREAHALNFGPGLPKAF
ncbi:MAG: hypothetical protein MUF15_02695 [Acidobacteria bacterium]|jgi:hypothetical protein|nr:hypothetical protein [Acidobacteriota bacterium]